MLPAFEKDLETGKMPSARVIISDDQTGYLQPILINKPLCLNFHRTIGKKLDNEDYRFIRDLYPGDEATGYQPGDLRGMWHIQFIDDASL